MGPARKMCRVCALVWLLAASGGRAQGLAEAGPATTPASIPATTEDALHGMAQQAAVVFAGQVVGVRRVGGMDGATGVVEIEFAVDDAVRGVSGASYTLREWAGLWAGGDQPLRAGQRYLMLLHAPSAAGLTSPVGGTDGAIPIRGGLAGVQADGRTVDLRWVATRVVRPVAYTVTAHPTALPVGVRAGAVAAAPAQEMEAGDGAQCGEASVAAGATIAARATIAVGARDAGYATVLALLRSWASASDAAR